MNRPITRRLLLAGMGSSAALALAGCSTTLPRTALAQADANAPSRRHVPAAIAAAYAEVNGEPYPVRASRMELVPERFWRQDVADPTGESPGSVVVDTTERFLYHVGRAAGPRATASASAPRASSGPAGRISPTRAHGPDGRRHPT